MDTNMVMNLISTLGFPIIACGALFWYTVKQTETHKAEIDNLTIAVNNNTLVMQKFLDKMGDK